MASKVGATRCRSFNIRCQGLCRGSDLRVETASAAHPAGALAHAILQLPRDAEVAEFHGAGTVQKQVSGLQIAVHHPQLPVQVQQPDSTCGRITRSDWRPLLSPCAPRLRRGHCPMRQEGGSRMWVKCQVVFMRHSMLTLPTICAVYLVQGPTQRVL